MTDRRFQDGDPARETSTSEREWLEVVRSELDPGRRTPAERAAFRVRLDERIESRDRFVWQPWVMTTGVAVVATLLWFAMPGNQSEGTSRPGGTLVSAGAPGLLSYAYYETDYLASSESGDGFLSDEYLAIANTFEVP